MLIETERLGNRLVVNIGGELDMETADEFRRIIEEALDSDRSIRHLILNLDKVEFIDSSGLGVILGRFKRLSQQGGRVSFINVSASVRRILELAGMLKIMTVYENSKQALEIQ